MLSARKIPTIIQGKILLTKLSLNGTKETMRKIDKNMVAIQVSTPSINERLRSSVFRLEFLPSEK